MESGFNQPDGVLICIILRGCKPSHCSEWKSALYRTLIRICDGLCGGIVRGDQQLVCEGVLTPFSVVTIAWDHVVGKQLSQAANMEGVVTSD